MELSRSGGRGTAPGQPLPPPPAPLGGGGARGGPEAARARRAAPGGRGGRRRCFRASAAAPAPPEAAAAQSGGPARPQRGAGTLETPTGRAQPRHLLLGCNPPPWRGVIGTHPPPPRWFFPCIFHLRLLHPPSLLSRLCARSVCAHTTSPGGRPLVCALRVCAYYLSWRPAACVRVHVCASPGGRASFFFQGRRLGTRGARRHNPSSAR